MAGVSFTDLLRHLLSGPGIPSPVVGLPDPRAVTITAADGATQRWEIGELELSPDGRLHMWFNPLEQGLIAEAAIGVVSGTWTADGVHIKLDDPDSVASSDEDAHRHAQLCAAVQPTLHDLRQLRRLLTDAHLSAIFRAGRSYARCDVADAHRLGVLLDVYGHPNRDVRATALAMLASTTIQHSPHTNGAQVLAVAEAATRP